MPDIGKNSWVSREDSWHEEKGDLKNPEWRNQSQLVIPSVHIILNAQNYVSSIANMSSNMEELRVSIPFEGPRNPGILKPKTPVL